MSAVDCAKISASVIKTRTGNSHADDDVNGFERRRMNTAAAITRKNIIVNMNPYIFTRKFVNFRAYYFQAY